jgi:hypothetical protein
MQRGATRGKRVKSLPWPEPTHAREHRSLGVRASQAEQPSHPARPGAVRVRWRSASSAEEGKKVGDDE